MTTALSPSAQRRLRELHATYPDRPKRRFHVTGRGNWRHEIGYTGCTIMTDSGTPITHSTRFGPNSPEAAALLSAVERYWAALVSAQKEAQL